MSSFTLSQAQMKLDFKEALKNERVMKLSQIADSIQYVKKIKSTVTVFDALGFTDNNTLVRLTSQNGMNGGRFMFEKVSLPSGEIEDNPIVRIIYLKH